MKQIAILLTFFICTLHGVRENEDILIWRSVGDPGMSMSDVIAAGERDGITVYQFDCEERKEVSTQPQAPSK